MELSVSEDGKGQEILARKQLVGTHRGSTVEIDERYELLKGTSGVGLLRSAALEWDRKALIERGAMEAMHDGPPSPRGRWRPTIAVIS